MKDKTLRILEFYKVLNLIKDYATSSIGKNEILNLRPTSKKLKIEQDLKKINDAKILIDEKGTPGFAGLVDVRKDLHRASIGGNLPVSTLYDVRVMLSISRDIKKNYGGLKNNLVSELIDLLVLNDSLHDRLDRAIYDRESLADDATSLLKSLNRRKVQKNEEISDRLKEFISKKENEKYLQESIITLRDGRYVIPVKREYKNQITGIVHDVSGSGGTYFIEPQKIVNLNNEIKLIENEIESEKRRIIKDFSSEIGSISEDLKYNIELLAELDFIIAKTKFGIENDYTIPIFSDKMEFKLIDIFHPLIEKEKVIRTDIFMEEGNKALIITGPNTGGKTVILKTVGIISLLAQSGCMIPAGDGSIIPIYNEVFTDIGDEQSIEQSLSTFSSHMTNIIEILDNGSNDSLYLFDELGAGTDPTEGAALAMSIIDILKDKNVKIIASTHYAELKAYALNTEGVVNGSMQFSVETLRPTYKLIIGIPGKSNAFEISKKLGLSDRYIKKAIGFVDEASIKFESVLEEIEKTREHIELQKEEHEKALKEAEEIREEARKYARKEREKVEKEIEKARLDAKSLYEKAKKDYEDIIKDANKMIKNLNYDSARKIQERRDSLRENISNLSKTNSKKEEGKLKNKDIILGMRVKIISLDQEGDVLTLPNESGDLLVQVGILKINANVSDLEKKKEEAIESTSVKKYRINKSQFIKPEIDLRGVDTEELYDKLDKYIDDAFIAGLREVVILHGKGTGALRKATHESLKKNDHVKSFRLGKIGEGDTGVTVVTLK